MKPLEELLNIEKARLLHALFPGEMPALLQYVADVAHTMTEEEELTRSGWKDGLFSVDLWLSLASDIQGKIARYGNRMHLRSGLFADQLFDGYYALYMVHCMQLYTTTREHGNKKFVQAVEMLFL